MKIKDIIEIYQILSNKIRYNPEKYFSELNKLLETDVLGHTTGEDYNLYLLKKEYIDKHDNV